MAASCKRNTLNLLPRHLVLLSLANNMGATNSDQHGGAKQARAGKTQGQQNLRWCWTDTAHGSELALSQAVSCNNQQNNRESQKARHFKALHMLELAPGTQCILQQATLEKLQHDMAATQRSSRRVAAPRPPQLRPPHVSLMYISWLGLHALAIPCIYRPGSCAARQPVSLSVLPC